MQDIVENSNVIDKQLFTKLIIKYLHFPDPEPHSRLNFLLGVINELTSEELEKILTVIDDKVSSTTAQDSAGSEKTVTTDADRPHTSSSSTEPLADVKPSKTPLEKQTTVISEDNDCIVVLDSDHDDPQNVIVEATQSSPQSATAPFDIKLKSENGEVNNPKKMECSQEDRDLIECPRLVLNVCNVSTETSKIQHVCKLCLKKASMKNEVI